MVWEARGPIKAYYSYETEERLAGGFEPIVLLGLACGEERAIMPK